MQYLWFIVQKLKDRLQRAIQGNTSKEQIDTFVKDLSMENLPALFSALREKFPKDRKGKVTKWRDRKPNSKTRSILVHTRCYRGGGAVEVWELAVRGER